MCDPVTATIIGVAQAGMQIQGQKQAAKTQRVMQKRASDQERQRYLNQVSAVRMQQAQEQVAMAQRIQASTTKAREARATARVSASEAGVAGLSVDALMNSLTQQEAQYRFSETQQQEMSNVATALNLRDAALGSQMNQLRINKPIEKPNYLGSLLSGAQTGFSLAGTAKDAGMKPIFK